MTDRPPLSQTPEPRRGLLHDRTFRRYVTFQAASWVIAVLAAIVAVHHGFLGPLVAAALVAAWIVKDLLIYRFVRHAYETGSATPSERLIGGLAVVERDLAPEGIVRLGHEVWAARLDGGGALGTGERVRVLAVEGMVLVVERETP